MYLCNSQRLQKLIYLHLPTECFMKISLQSTANANKLTYVLSVHKAPHWAHYHVWFKNKSELYLCNAKLWFIVVYIINYYIINTWHTDQVSKLCMCITDCSKHETFAILSFCAPLPPVEAKGTDVMYLENVNTCMFLHNHSQAGTSTTMQWHTV